MGLAVKERVRRMESREEFRARGGRPQEARKSDGWGDSGSESDVWRMRERFGREMGGGGKSKMEMEQGGGGRKREGKEKCQEERAERGNECVCVSAAVTCFSLLPTINHSPQPI